MSWYDTIAGGLDHAAGSVDEAVGRQFDDEPGGGVVDPDTVGSVVNSGWDATGQGYDWLAGGADHLAGSVDEAVGRQFDDEQGGGVFDWDTTAGWFDHMAGSVDESVGRQFDDEPGGGVADEIAGGSWDFAAGFGDWAAGDVDEQVGQASRAVRLAALGGTAAVGLAVVAEVAGGGDS